MTFDKWKWLCIYFWIKCIQCQVFGTPVLSPGLGEHDEYEEMKYDQPNDQQSKSASAKHVFHHHPDEPGQAEKQKKIQNDWIVNRESPKKKVAERTI